MDLLLTGRWMEVAEAHRWGLVNEILPADKLLDRARELARLLAIGPPLVFAAIKEVVRETEACPSRRRCCRDPLIAASAASTSSIGSDDQKEGARAFAEKRPRCGRGEQAPAHSPA